MNEEFYYNFDEDDYENYRGPFGTIENCIEDAQAEGIEYYNRCPTIYIYKDNFPIMNFVIEGFKPMFDIDEFMNMNYDCLHDVLGEIDLDDKGLLDEDIDQIEYEINQLPREKKQELANKMQVIFLSFCKENNLFQGNIIGDCIQTVENKGYVDHTIMVKGFETF